MTTSASFPEQATTQQRTLSLNNKLTEPFTAAIRETPPGIDVSTTNTTNDCSTNLGRMVDWNDVSAEEAVVLLVVVLVSVVAVDIINVVRRLFTIRNAEDHCEKTASSDTKRYRATMMEGILLVIVLDSLMLACASLALHLARLRGWLTDWLERARARLSIRKWLSIYRLQHSLLITLKSDYSSLILVVHIFPSKFRSLFLSYKVGPSKGVFCMAACNNFHRASGSVPMDMVPSADPINKNW